MTTVNMLIAATEVGCKRIVLPGSSEEPDEPFAYPASPYAASKLAASAYGRMFYQLFKTPVVIARVFITYGPTKRQFYKLIPYIILSAFRGEAPQLSSGRREVDLVYIDDVIEGLLAIAQTDHSNGKTLDVGSGVLVSIREIVERLVRILNPVVMPMFSTHLDRPLERVIVADVQTTLQVTGWRPRVSIDEGLKKTVAWFTEHFKEDRSL